VRADTLAHGEVAWPRLLPLAPWRDAVRASKFALGLIELPSTSFLELSPPAKELLGPGTEGARGLDFLDPVKCADAAQIVGLATSGALDGTQTRRRWRRMDGSTMEVRTWGRAIRQPGEHDAGLWVAYDLTPTNGEQGAGFSLPGECAPGPSGSERGLKVTAVASLDPHWRFSDIDHAEDLVGQPAEAVTGTSLVDLTHPDDVPALLFAFARTTSDVHASLGMRLRHLDGSWRSVDVDMTLSEADQPYELALTLTERDADSAAQGGRVAELSERLRRIAHEVHSSGLVLERGSGSNGVAPEALDGLSPRQAEILHRLLRGERVPMIAREMFLSASTVRNHLSMTFQKFEVHSQQELLTRLLRDDPPGDLAT
jgi:DNA-binding CsgD family transcriptional regulator/PAS domain-containing protein